MTFVLLPILTSSSTSTDGEGHRLPKLWQEYRKAQQKDLPKNAAESLDKIKKEAVRLHYLWDFYDAGQQYVEARVRSNWKLRDSLQKAFRSELEAFGEPVALYYLRRGENEKELLAYIQANEKALRKSSNPEFWKRDWKLQQYKFSQALLPLLKSDWDYCLWSLFPEGRVEDEFGSYPLKAFAEYQGIAQKDRDAALKSFVQKHKGKAASLLAAEDLLRSRFAALDDKGSSDDYKALRKECEALIMEGKSYKDGEKQIADCCKGADALIKILDSKGIDISIEDSVLELGLRNLEGADVKIFKDKQKVWETSIDNPKLSYYAVDSIKLPLPPLPDGRYSVSCSKGKTEDSINWEKYTISAASRWNESGLGIWAADFRSGEPIAKADLELLRDGAVFKKAEGIDLNGFTPLPESMTGFLRNPGTNSYTLRVRSGKRCSDEIYAGSYYRPDLSDDPSRENCIILTDRSAFQPDETMHFKAILYTGKFSFKADAGAQVKVSLRDTKGDLIEEKELTANAFGSVAGDFKLQRRDRNGNYFISVGKGNRVIAQKAVKVDDFVLPSFDLVFDPVPELYYPIDSVSVKGIIKAYSGHSINGGDISYKVEHWGEEWQSGKLFPEKDRFEIKFPSDNSKTYRWGDSYTVTVKVTDVTGETMEFQKWISIGRRNKPEIELDHFFEDLKSENSIGARVVAGTKETWIIAELYGTGNKLLESKLLRFEPSAGGLAEARVEYPYLAEYPEALVLNLLYFQDKQSFAHSVSLSRPDHSCDMPLSFERFLDTTVPGAQYTFTVRTLAGAEVAATVFDKSTERFMTNKWTHARPLGKPAPYVYYSPYAGKDEGERRLIISTGYSRNGRFRSKAAYGADAEMSAMALADEAMPQEAPATAEEAVEEAAADIPIREDFATTIAWEPFLKASSDGLVKFTFTNADKLSTFYVQLFSHDAAMRNETVRKEMLVTIPVKISLVEPKFLYEKDKWTVRVGLASNLSTDVAGTLAVTFMDGEDRHSAARISSYTKKISVPAGSSSSVDIPFEAPSGISSLGLQITFAPSEIRNASDGVFVSVPVKKTEQTLSEAHSAVLLSGMDRTILEAELRRAFVNVPGAAAEMKEISIMDMIREALPEAIDPRCENAIALSSALYAAALCDSLGINPKFERDAAKEKLLALQGSDGGFAWFKGMQSSAIVTAIVLQRLHSLGIINEAAAVHFMDKEYFNRDKKRWWYCGLSLGQYLYTRSLFPEVSFQEKTTSDFRKEARAYLVSTKERGLAGAVFAKARRLLTLDNLSGLEGGTALARKLGIRLFAAKRLARSIKADAASLAQYAEAHRHGGIYYPNAVMPWRGLLESELYAHSMLCTLMNAHGHGEIAEGIRLWIMLQKETQHWESDPGYIEAIAAVMKAGEKTKDTKVLALKAVYTKAFDEIKASGNGMSIGGRTVKGTLSEGSPAVLKVGDRVRISWELSSEENRSFVRVTLPHTAGLVPVNQISGYSYGCYRSVLADRTELWYEAYPEEKITVSEEYYVTRAGSFQSPAAQIECLYAPHYRANTAAPEREEISL